MIESMLWIGMYFLFLSYLDFLLNISSGFGYMYNLVSITLPFAKSYVRFFRWCCFNIYKIDAFCFWFLVEPKNSSARLHSGHDTKRRGWLTPHFPICSIWYFVDIVSCIAVCFRWWHILRIEVGVPETGTEKRFGGVYLFCSANATKFRTFHEFSYVRNLLDSPHSRIHRIRVPKFQIRCEEQFDDVDGCRTTHKMVENQWRFISVY